MSLFRACIAFVAIVALGNQTSWATGDSTRVMTSQLSLSYGIGIPTGTFASIDKTSDESGYALDGSSWDLTYTLRNEVKPYGFLATIRSSNFNYNTEAYTSNHENGDTWTGRGDNWTSIFVQLGIFRHVRVGNSFSVEPKAAMGALFLGAKNQTVVRSGSRPLRLYYASEPAASYAFLLGFNLKCKVTNHLAIVAALDYFTSTPSVLYTFRVVTNRGSQTTPGAFYQPISAFSILGGISYAF